jgi:hypothetical protein
MLAMSFHQPASQLKTTQELNRQIRAANNDSSVDPQEVDIHKTTVMILSKHTAELQ